MLIFVFFLGLIFLGLPVSFSFVVAGIFYLLNFTTVSPNIIATTTFTGIDNFALLAIPFFILPEISCVRVVFRNDSSRLPNYSLKTL